MRLSAWYLPILLFSVISVSLAETQPLRLRGTVVSTGGIYLAIIETPDGGQRLYQQGDVLGAGRIRQILAHSVTVDSAQGEYTLKLKGSGSRGLMENQEPVIKSVSTKITGKSIAELNKIAANSTHMEDAVLQKKLNELLNLPENANIVSVDHQPIKLTSEIVSKLAAILNKDDPPHLEIEGVEAIDEVYVIPEDKWYSGDAD
jgi:hypothetical protein